MVVKLIDQQLWKIWIFQSFSFQFRSSSLHHQDKSNALIFGTSSPDLSIWPRLHPAKEIS